MAGLQGRGMYATLREKMSREVGPATVSLVSLWFSPPRAQSPLFLGKKKEKGGNCISQDSTEKKKQ